MVVIEVKPSCAWGRRSAEAIEEREDHNCSQFPELPLAVSLLWPSTPLVGPLGTEGISSSAVGHIVLRLEGDSKLQLKMTQIRNGL